jgi:hypothetical protein
MRATTTPAEVAPQSEASREKDAVCLFAYARAKRLTGTLELWKPQEELAATVVIERGSVSKIKTAAPVALLSSVLGELGYLDAAILRTSLVELGRRERLHGEILLANGHITAAQLHKGLHEQVTQKLDYVLSLAKVAFSFHEEANLLVSYGGKEIVRVDPLASIWRSVREAPPEEHLRASLDRIADTRCRLASAEQVVRFRFSPEELTAVDCLRTRDLTLAELRAHGLLSPRDTELLFYVLLITKQLEAAGVPATSHETGAKPEEAGAPPSSRVTPATDREARRTWTWRGVPSQLLQQQSPSDPPPSRPSTPSMQASVSGSAPDSQRALMPGVAPSPRRHSSSTPLVAPPPRRHSSSTPLAVTPPPRQSSSSVPAASVRPSPASQPSSHTYAMGGPSLATSAADPPTVPKGPPVQMLLAHGVFERARTILREDYFQRLGLTTEATVEAIEAAFHEEARAWGGPVPPEVEGAQEAQDTVLTALLEAQEVLADSGLRDAYTKGLIHGRG